MQRYLSLGKSADVDYPLWVPVGGELLIMPRWESRIVCPADDTMTRGRGPFLTPHGSASCQA
jgi:hypothetical protein